MRRLSLVLVLLVSAAFCVEDLPLFHKWVPDSVVFRPPVHHWTLPNGLEVLFWENHTVPLVSARVLIKTGSALEGKYVGCGISHYLEHIVSGGTTTKHTEAEYKKMVQEYGLSTNAFTTAYVTVYYGTGPAKHFDKLLGILAEWVQSCAFDTFEISREVKVILQEMKKCQEEPDRVLWRLYKKLYYQVSPYRHPTIGYRENFLRVTRDELIDYYRRRYAPNNAILAIAGDLDTSLVKRVVDSLWSGWQMQPVEPVWLPAEPLPVAARVAEKEMDVEIAQFQMGFPTVYFGDDDLPALKILAVVLSGAKSSRLDMRLVNRPKPLAHSITAFLSTPYMERAQFIIGGSFDYNNRDSLLEAIWDEIDRIKRGDLSDDEVEWAKRMVKKAIQRQNETVEGQVASIVSSFLRAGKPHYSDFFLRSIMRVQTDDVVRVCRKYLVPEHMILAIVKPLGASLPSDSLLSLGRSLSRPRFELRKLENGLTLVLAENPALPTVDIAVYVMGGSVFEPQGKRGLAKFTANYLLEGTKKYPKFERLQRAIDDLGMILETGAGKHTMYLTANFLASDLKPALDILEQVLLHPVFPRESRQKLLESQLGELKAMRGSWYSDAALLFWEKFYAGHPYATPVAGVEGDVRDLRAEDAKRYWFSHLDPTRMVIAASGPVSVERFAEEFSRRFGDFGGGASDLPQVPPPRRHESPERYEKEVHRDQVTLIVGFDGCDARNESDKFALRAAAALLSGTGGLSGWLLEELRGKRDLVYVAWASAQSQLFGGHVSVVTQCQPEDVDTVVAVIMSLVDRLRRGDFREKELSRAVNALAEQFLRSRQTQADLVQTAALDQLYGFGYDYSESYPEKIRAVTKDDVVRVAQKYLKNPVVVMLKPAESTEGGDGR